MHRVNNFWYKLTTRNEKHINYAPVFFLIMYKFIIYLVRVLILLHDGVSF